MRVLLLLGLFAIICIWPSFWARRVMRRHDADRSDIPGTGGELARHLLDEAGLDEVAVERTELGDHYDPKAKAVRLSKTNHDGKSLTAVAVAAHEVGHALQDRDRDPRLALRQRLVSLANVGQKVGILTATVLPLLSAVAISPKLGLVLVALGILTIGTRVAADLVTLPVEFDASFNKALPILRHGNYLKAEDLPAAREILKACAWTYVAASLLSMVDIFRWIRILRGAI